MNERIKKLALQARHDSRNEMHYLERIHNREISLDEYQEIYDEKFAELIVRECTNVVGTAVDQREPASTYVGKIKQHFGVK